MARILRVGANSAGQKQSRDCDKYWTHGVLLDGKETGGMSEVPERSVFRQV
jgi:hypothetical protein